MITMIDAMRVVEEQRGSAVVIPTMMGSRGWAEVTQNEELDVPLGGAMGKASSFGLGLALARPDRKIIVFDGDGSLLMNLGSLVTVGDKAPENFYHFVMENGVYAVTGGQPIPGKGKVSFAGLAKASGYANAYDFDDLEEFASNAQRILDEKGPVLICLKTEPEIENRPIGERPRARRRITDAIKDLVRILGQ